MRQATFRELGDQRRTLFVVSASFGAGRCQSFGAVRATIGTGDGLRLFAVTAGQAAFHGAVDDLCTFFFGMVRGFTAGREFAHVLRTPLVARQRLVAAPCQARIENTVSGGSTVVLAATVRDALGKHGFASALATLLATRRILVTMRQALFQSCHRFRFAFLFGSTSLEA